MAVQKRDAPDKQLANTVRELMHADASRHRKGIRFLIYGTGLIELSNAGKELEGWTDDQVEHFRADCLTFLRSLVQAADQAGRASSGLSLQGPVTFRAMASKGKAYTLAWGSARDVMILQLLSLLQLAGVDRLRVCPAHNCEQLFVKVHKSEYCSTTCRNRAAKKNQRDRERELDRRNMARLKGRR